MYGLMSDLKFSERKTLIVNQHFGIWEKWEMRTESLVWVFFEKLYNSYFYSESAQRVIMQMLSSAYINCA